MLPPADDFAEIDLTDRPSPSFFLDESGVLGRTKICAAGYSEYAFSILKSHLIFMDKKRIFQRIAGALRFFASM